jgi:hypothetical protein
MKEIVSQQMPEVTVKEATTILLDEAFSTLMVDHSHLDYMRETLRLFFLEGARQAVQCCQDEILFPKEKS